MALLLAEPGLEVTEGELRSGGRMTLVPGSADDGIEACYLLAGRLVEVAGGGRCFHAGDLLAGTGLDRELILSADGHVRFLYLATRPQFHAMSRSMNELMKLAREVEQKDGYTADHCLRLQRLSFATGRELGLDSHRLYLLDYGAYLHDVGKVRVPVSILQKPGALDEEEWAVIRRHPTHGRELVERTFLNDAGTIIEQHHERMDGSGYPRGLSRDEILPESAIVAIVDTYDAMTTDRSYRKALPSVVALEEIERLAGVQWPLDYVKAFKSVLPTLEAPPPSSLVPGGPS